VPQGYEEDPKLAKWVNRQRTIIKNGKMGKERKRMLYAIGFEFNGMGNLKIMTNEEKWNLQFKKLRDYCGKHGDCELSWPVDRFTFILKIPTLTTSPVSLRELQAMCHTGTRKTLNCANGSKPSVHASKLVEWFRNEEGSSTKLVSISISLSVARA
jgi:hypothetical protein